MGIRAKQSGAFVQPLPNWTSNMYYIFWVCVCSLSYPACNAHASYCHLWPCPTLQYIFHIISEWNDFLEKKNYWTSNVCFDFLCNFFWNISHYNKNWGRCDQKCKLVFMESTSYSCQILYNLNFLNKISKNNQRSNSTNIRPVQAESFHADGRTDRQTDMTKLIVTFRNFPNALKNGGWVKICNEEIAIHFKVPYFDILIQGVREIWNITPRKFNGLTKIPTTFLGITRQKLYPYITFDLTGYKLCGFIGKRKLFYYISLSVSLGHNFHFPFSLYVEPFEVNLRCKISLATINGNYAFQSASSRPANYEKKNWNSIVLSKYWVCYSLHTSTFWSHRCYVRDTDPNHFTINLTQVYAASALKDAE